MINPSDQRNNPTEKGAVVGITASSAALVVAQQEADFALTHDHLAGARVSMWLLHLLLIRMAILLTHMGI